MNNLHAPARTVNRTFRSLAGLLVAATALALALPAAAAVVYDNGGADGSRGWWSDFKIGQQVSDGFVLSAGNNTFNGARWSGAYYPNNTVPVTDNFVIRIFSDAGGVPGLTPINSFSVGNAVTRVDSGLNDATWGIDIFDYSAAIATTTLTAGTTYWLSVVNDTTGQSDDWLWENSLQSGNASFRNGDGNPWSNFDVELAFQLTFTPTTPVPEPETYAMLLAGLGLLGFAARRRKLKEAAAA